MNDNKKKPTEDTSGKAALERGKKAIDAQQRLRGEEKGLQKAKAEDKDDAEKWRQEG